MHRRLMRGVLGLTLLGLATVAGAQTAPDILAYEIPRDAIVQKGDRKQGQAMYYYQRRADGSRGNLVADEYLSYRSTEAGGQLILQSRALYFPTNEFFGPLHGVQQDWYWSGQLQSERPYRMGVKDGQFRYFDEAGQLVGQFQMTKGTGVARIYTGDGRLQVEKHFREGREEGLSYNFSLPNQMDFEWRAPNSSAGMAFGYSGRLLVSLRIWNGQGKGHGPTYRFDLVRSAQGLPPTGGTPEFAVASEKKEWQVNGQSVSAAEYTQAAAQDKTLPPYFEDMEQYLPYVNAEIPAMVEATRNLPRVKIPLEFDAQGNPVLATEAAPQAGDVTKPLVWDWKF